MTLIKVNHLKKTYDNVTPAKDICAEINKGDIISIIGPSGTGKSTFLRCLNMLETPTEGEIIIEGEDITKPGVDLAKIRQKMGMVFQNFNLFPHKMVIENIMMAPVDLLGISPQEAYDEGLRLLEMVGLKNKAMNYPDELSGGQKQRVAIARALAMKPQIVLFDEPTSALDPTMVTEVLSVIKMLAKQGLTMMIVTHEMRFAKDISTKVFYMDQGVIYEEGTPQQIFENPQKELTRKFILKIRHWEWLLKDRDNDFHAMMGSLENFAIKQFLSAKQFNRLKLAIEELTTTDVLFPTNSSGKKKLILIDVNAAEEGKEIKIKLTSRDFEKVFFEKLQNADNTDISMKMLSKMLILDKIDEAESSVEFKLKVEN
ncbi:MAG: amino acid ABC transporter ATP-binding protein [Candidatus Riflebacteria bacterium]|nr:amino acid ABC transporter ATP-binding protein [Candidatus Riflebacteria bacterium]